MYLIILGLALGLVMGAFLQFNIPPEYTRYTAVAIIGLLDSIFGAVRASVEKKYNTTVFLTGLTFNMIFAVIITFFGDKLNLDLYLAVSIAFMIRILANIGSIKSATVSMIQKKISNNPLKD
ncbi:MAG: small basic family protein [Candidatus Berkelbacteria bacterium]|nr:small basic family protein [Candidatus Berkelbacteria bacterium]